MVRSVTTRTPEWDRGQVDLLLAHKRLTAEVGEHGYPMSVAQDPAHAWDWVSTPYTDYAAKTLAEDQRDYYEKWDTDKEHPMLRTEVWQVRLRDDIPPQPDREEPPPWANASTRSPS